MRTLFSDRGVTKLDVVAFQDGDIWVSACPEINAVSQGRTLEESLDAIIEAVQFLMVDCLEGVVSFEESEDEVLAKVRAELLEHGVPWARFKGIPRQVFTQLFVCLPGREVLLSEPDPVVVYQVPPGWRIVNVHSDTA
jgi:predicted RNase H-like HicB family nuclease